MDNCEITINFKDFLKYCFKKIKYIIVIAIIFAILGEAFGYIKASKKKDNYENDLLKYEESYKKYEEKHEYLMNLCSVERKVYDDALAYYETSYRMNLDVNKVVFSVIEFDIKLIEEPVEEENEENQEEKKEQLVDKHSTMLLFGTLKDNVLRFVNWDKLEKKLGVDRKEIIQVIELYPKLEEYTLSMLIKWENEAGAQAITDEVLAAFDANIEKISTVPGYKIDRMSSGVGAVEDSGLINEKDYMNSVLEEYKSTLEETEAALENCVEPVKPSNEMYSKKNYIKAGLKYMVLSGMLGVLVGVYLLYEYFARKGIVYSVSEYERISGHMLLSDFRSFSDEVALERMNLNLSAVLKDEKKIMLVSEKSLDRTEYIKDNINKKNKATVTIGVNPLADNKVINELKDIDAVVFVYCEKKTSVQTIMKYNKLLEVLDKKVIGCIVV